MIDRPFRERAFFFDDHDYYRSLPKTVNVRRRPVSMIVEMHSNGNPPSPVPSPMRRLSVHRPLRSSPLAGPALSSEGLVIPEDDIQRRCKPSRISSSPELPSGSSFSSIYQTDRTPSPPSEIAKRPTLNQRNSSPSHLAVPIVSLLKSPSAPSLHMPLTASPSPSSPETSSRPSSIESVTSIPSPTLVPRSPPAASGDWLITNTYGETPRFSRISMGSNVVMPVSAKEYRRKSIASVKSIPNLSKRASSPPGLIMRSRSGSSGVRSEEADTTCSSEHIRSVQSTKSISSLASKVRRRASTILTVRSDSSESQSLESAPSMLQSSSVTSLSSATDYSLLSPSPPRAPGSARSRGSSNSDCTIIDEEAEDDMPATSECFVPLSHTQSLPEKRKESKRVMFLLKFRRIVGVHRLIRPRVSGVS